MSRLSVADLLACNDKWASDVEASHAGFFGESAKGQAPSVLWFGCADSRVPESVVCGQEPGRIFVSPLAAREGGGAQAHEGGPVRCTATLPTGSTERTTRRMRCSSTPSSTSRSTTVSDGGESGPGKRAQLILWPRSRRRRAHQVRWLHRRIRLACADRQCWGGGCYLSPVNVNVAESPHAEQKDALGNFLAPLIELRHSLPAGSTMTDLVKANVKRGVEEIVASKVGARSASAVAGGQRVDRTGDGRPSRTFSPTRTRRGRLSRCMGEWGSR